MPWTRRLAVALAVAAALIPAASAEASPVKCATGDVTPDDRVFPEAMVSATFLRFDELECGIKLLESQYPGLVEVRNIGTSAGGRPLYDVLLTDESVQPAEGEKEKLLVVSSIHGDEVGGREGGARVIEEMLDPDLMGDLPWVKQVLDEFVVHFVFPNPDGWANGDVLGAYSPGVQATRGNESGRDLNRQFPVKGWIDTNNKTLVEPEGNAVLTSLFSEPGWYLGTDNHGQLNDTYAAAGLQIVGQFDYQKSETLARFADGITESMKAYNVLRDLETLRDATGQDLGAYHWGTLYDMLGYSASGSMIDHYNTADGLDGTGFATELTVGREVNWLTYPAALNQVWVDSIRAINYTMFQQAIDRKKFTFDVGSKAAYVFDPEVIRHDDANGPGFANPEGTVQAPYAVSRMKFFSDLNRHASRPLTSVRVGELLAEPAAKPKPKPKAKAKAKAKPKKSRKGRKVKKAKKPKQPPTLNDFDTLVLANDAMPEPADEAKWYAKLKDWVQRGGNLIVTDAAAKALPKLGLVGEADVTMAKHYVGFVQFGDRSHPLNANLRGVASQTYDTVPIGYRFGGGNSAPNWKVAKAAWEAAGGTTLGTNGSDQTIYGELPVGKGRVRFLGALLPDPTEEFFHPYGLQNYAVTYTGYTLLQNMLRVERAARRR